MFLLVVLLLLKRLRKFIDLSFLSLSCSQLRREGRVASVGDVVQRGQRVKVKVLSMAGSKISLSIKVRQVKQHRTVYLKYW